MSCDHDHGAGHSHDDHGHHHDPHHSLNPSSSPADSVEHDLLPSSSAPHGSGSCCDNSAPPTWQSYLPHGHSLNHRLLADTHTLSLALAILACTVLLQALFALFSSSSALFAESLHTCLDGLTVFLSLIAARVSRRRPTPSKPFGYARTETLAALLSVSALALLCLKLLLTSLRSLADMAHHAPIHGNLVVLAEALTLASNIIMAALLSRQPDPSLNLRALRAHVIADSVETSLVLIAGGVMWAVPSAAIIDPLLTFTIAVLLAYFNYPIAREAFTVLLQASPPAFDSNACRARIFRIPHVAAVPVLRAWTLTCDVWVGDVVVVVLGGPDMRFSEVDDVRRAVKTILMDEGVTVATVEVGMGEGGKEVDSETSDVDVVVYDPHTHVLPDV